MKNEVEFNPILIRKVGVLDIGEESIPEGLLKLIRDKAWSCEDPEPNKLFNFYELESFNEDVQNGEIEDVSEELKENLNQLYQFMKAHDAWWARFC
jgi:hypothetical protein